jgi:hypothetical protein
MPRVLLAPCRDGIWIDMDEVSPSEAAASPTPVQLLQLAGWCLLADSCVASQERVWECTVKMH